MGHCRGKFHYLNASSGGSDSEGLFTGFVGIFSQAEGGPTLYWPRPLADVRNEL